MHPEWQGFISGEGWLYYPVMWGFYGIVMSYTIRNIWIPIKQPVFQLESKAIFLAHVGKIPSLTVFYNFHIVLLPSSTPMTNSHCFESLFEYGLETTTGMMFFSADLLFPAAHLMRISPSTQDTSHFRYTESRNGALQSGSKKKLKRDQGWV